MTTPLTTFIWVKCPGEAHDRRVAGNIDHCMICMPDWGWIPKCPTCGKRVRETTTDDMANRGETRFWCRTCRKHLLAPLPETKLDVLD